MNIGISLSEVQAAGFPMGAEPLVALDLADTLMTATDPVTDLIADPERARSWWQLQSPRLPESPMPELGALRRLRAAARELFESRVEGRLPDPVAVEDINATAASVPSSPRLSRDVTGRETRWHTEHGGNAALAAIAAQTIELFADEAAVTTLRRCANPECSMLFLATNRRRTWCTANICGNRARVARHYERTHRDPADGV